MLMPYRYKSGLKEKFGFRMNRVPTYSDRADPVPLTGFVAGRRASNLEERFARALRSAGLVFRFQVRFSTQTSLPGHDKVVDFVVRSGGMLFPVEVDGQIGHKTSAQRGLDELREVLLNETFAKRGYMPLTRVRWFELETQEMADAVVRRLFIR